LKKGQTVWDKEAMIARKAAKAAGKILLDLFGKDAAARKKGEIDLVTDADIRSEETVVNMIRRQFPKDSILAEESGEIKQDAERVWIIDPLDGTTNFAHSFPVFAVSIALEVQREIVLGVVFNPVRREHYEAVRGMGASLNGRPISVSRIATLQDSLLATGFPYDVHEHPDRVLLNFRSMITRAQGIRRPGAAALDLCFVAAGILDGFWEEGLKPWDSAAGAIILEEAGGKLTTYDGLPFSPYEETIVASNSLIHDSMLAALRNQD
jgi:myo-inositol-1(or 4)-monophosphatase